MKSARAIALTEALLFVALLGGGFMFAKNKWFHGDTKRAEASAKATAQVNTATEDLLAAEQQRGATAAASVAKIGEAIVTAPDSPEKIFVGREVPVALANLPTPDPKALLEAERRRVAVMEGRIAEADRLYGVAMQRAEQLLAERDSARRDLEHAREARAKADAELLRVAAARQAAEQQRMVLIVVALAVAGLWLWVKLTHWSPKQVANAVTDIAHGETPIHALDTHSTSLQQRLVRFFKP